MSEGRNPDAIDKEYIRLWLGERGLQLLSRSLDRVEETIDVGPRNRVSAMGRHLVTANGTGIQVVDSTPWAVDAAPAAKSSH